MTVVRAVLAAAVVAGAIVVLAGLGQGSPQPTPKLSAQASNAQARRVSAGSHGVQAGRRVFNAEGCKTCHTIASADSHGTLGPRLDVTLKGTPRRVIEGYITDPKTVRLPGYDNDLMPRDYAKRLDAGDIRAIASFLHAAAG